MKSLLEIIPFEFHGIGDYAAVVILGMFAIAAVLWSSHGLRRGIALVTIAGAMVLVVVWIHARHTWTHALITKANADAEATKAEVARRDTQIAAHEKTIASLQAKIAQVEAGVKDDDAAAEKDDEDIDRRAAREAKLEREVDAKEQELGDKP